MILENYLSNKGRNIDHKVDLVAGTLAWNRKSKIKAKTFPNFINATIGSAIDDSGNLIVPQTLLDEMKNLSGDQLFKYAPLRGIPAFVEAWKKDTLESFPSELRKNADSLSTTPITSAGGLTSGLMITSQVFFNENDVLMAPNSRWGNVDNVFFKNYNLKEKSYQLVDENGKLSFTDLVDKLRIIKKEVKKIGIYLNFPNNPSGISPSLQEIKILQEVLEELEIPTLVILDDAYEGYVYDENAINHSLFPYLVGLNENVLVAKVDGVSKRYCAYGARLGLVTIGFGEEVDGEMKFRLRELIAKTARANTSSAPRGIQEALLTILTDQQKKERIKKEKQGIFRILKERYELVKKLSFEQESEKLLPVQFNSGFFSYYLVKNNLSSNDLGSKLLDKGLGTVPFSNEKNGMNGIRVAYCSIPKKLIPKAVELLYGEV
ncbi:MAG: aminotransferase class I/II-fold pyridoxal phosphate-dependent enzyme [Candidatus Heimdallarchaeaceae archaeon]